jgi:hypothetical protein
MSYKEFRGMLLSRSDMSDVTDPEYPDTMVNLKRIFDRFQEKGVLTSEYETEIIYGHL